MSDRNLTVAAELALNGVHTGWAPAAQAIADTMGFPTTVSNVAGWIRAACDERGDLTAHDLQAILGVEFLNLEDGGQS